MAALLEDARRGRLVREGLQVAILGRPNVGKSSLFNALVGSPRAIVAAVPGTTRDFITETIDLHGLRVTLVDTAGLQDSQDPVVSEGVVRTHGASAVADARLFVVDRSRPLEDEDRAMFSEAREGRGIVVASKADLDPAWSHDAAIAVSARTGQGLDDLRLRLGGALDIDLMADRPEITNVRHVALVQRAHDAVRRAGAAAHADGGRLPEEFVLADLQEARAAIEEITGRRTPDDVLAYVFARFCVGK
jgi:tRNA modification GTPase